MAGVDAIAHDAADASTEIERAAFRKAAWRLVPFLTLGYLLNYMDRNNVGFAALTMNGDTGLTATQFGFGAGILFLSYSAFEIPSNIALYRFGARRWIARIMITWGLVSAGMMFMKGTASFYALRFLLGLAEAVREINADYKKHSRAAREIACEVFEAEKVTGQILERAGI